MTFLEQDLFWDTKANSRHVPGKQGSPVTFYNYSRKIRHVKNNSLTVNACVDMKIFEHFTDIMIDWFL